MYQRVSMLLPTPDFSVHDTLDHWFPQKEHYTPPHLIHRILPIVITRDDQVYEKNKTRKR